MPEFTAPNSGEVVSFEVFCESCKDGLCGETTVIERYGRIKLMIRPCTQCAEREYDKGFANGEKSNQEA